MSFDRILKFWLINFSIDFARQKSLDHRLVDHRLDHGLVVLSVLGALGALGALGILGALGAFGAFGALGALSVGALPFFFW